MEQQAQQEIMLQKIISRNNVWHSGGVLEGRKYGYKK